MVAGNPARVWLTLAFVAVALLREVSEPPEGYAGNCAVLIDAVSSTGIVPVSIVEPPRRAAVCSTAQHGVLLRQFNQIDVWGVSGQQQLQTVLDSLQRTRSSEHTAPIHVRFWEKENWGKCPSPNAPGAHCPVSPFSQLRLLLRGGLEPAVQTGLL
jgi:hypothetical protein